jgi:hypothetical protein
LDVPAGQKSAKRKARKSPQARSTSKTSGSKQRQASTTTGRSRPSDLPVIDVAARVEGGRLLLAWQAGERVDRWMLTLLRRRNGVFGLSNAWLFP